MASVEHSGKEKEKEEVRGRKGGLAGEAEEEEQGAGR
ncbi:hypothetical protein E2C01_094750 [Portunus trituberculatus]|uniref:Uncharacterized protein n=1 Tax=Portunus trituberculatus TaxID=210409 RepID=A0A5B7JMZ6_PORTR|nr:hypothetical protein [Portunus trituberculatus]